MIRLGLCCLFNEEPIKFRTTTATYLRKLDEPKRIEKLEELTAHNAQALYEALVYCSKNNIGCFRVNSQILPLRTHPTCGYALEELPSGKNIIAAFKRCGTFAKEHNLRTTFHPDQFVVLNSPRDEVVKNSIAELEYQAEVAEWIHADVINIHGGGGYGDKPAAIARFQRNADKLSERVRTRLTLENDDKIYTPSELYRLCQTLSIPLVYDVHHHRCHKDTWGEEEATDRALETWNREPLFHVSSPREGWGGSKPNRHHDYIDIEDFPLFWHTYDLTVEVEAKAKELAVRKLQDEIETKLMKD